MLIMSLVKFEAWGVECIALDKVAWLGIMKLGKIIFLQWDFSLGALLMSNPIAIKLLVFETLLKPLAYRFDVEMQDLAHVGRQVGEQSVEAPVLAAVRDQDGPNRN